MTYRRSTPVLKVRPGDLVAPRDDVRCRDGNASLSIPAGTTGTVRGLSGLDVLVSFSTPRAVTVALLASELRQADRA